jgi:hypothetical protein
MPGSAFGTPLLDSRKSTGNKYAYRHRMGLVPCAEFDVFHDDFHSFMITTAITNGPVANTPLNGWSGAVIDTGATVVADTTVGHHTGALLFDSDGATEGAAIYTTKSFQLVSGKRFFMETRFKTEVADDSDVQFGLSALTAVSNPEDLWTTAAADLVAFGVLDGDATVKMLADKSDSGSTAETGTIDLTSATWHTLGIYFNGGSVLQGYVDGALALTWAQASTTIPTGVTLAAFVGFRNGSAATTEGHCDYIRVVSER